ncbi:MAG: hypothetical protein Q9190_003963 [Brigantiaea leucoxantha]
MSTTSFGGARPDAPNQTSRSQIFRRLSSHSNSASPNGRRVVDRVAKLQPAGTSQHGVQRRRTTTAHASAVTHRRNQDSVPSLPEVSKRGLQRSSRSQQPARPLTWHPGSWPAESLLPESLYAMALPESDVGEMPTVAYTNNDTSSDPTSFNCNFEDPQNTKAQFPMEYPPHVGISAPEPTPYSDGQFFYPPLSWGMLKDYQTNTTLLDYGCDTYPSVDLQSPEWSHTAPDYPIYSTQQTPSSFLVDYGGGTFDNTVNLPVPQITKQRSKELVGMGLYDGPDRDCLSKLDSSPEQLGLLLAEPQGKGLKLEETWQPPKNTGAEAEEEEEEEEDDDDEEEGYSTDEAEDDLPPAPAAAETQPTFIPTYADLSNQSFYFDGDDTYINCVALAHGPQVCQPKMANMTTSTFDFF